MKKSIQDVIRDDSTKELKKRKAAIYNKLVIKQKIIDKHKHLILQIKCNCMDLTNEHEILDRVIFVREGRVKIISSNSRERKEKELPVKKEIEDMTSIEQADLLKQLLAIQKRRSEVSSVKPQ